MAVVTITFDGDGNPSVDVSKVEGGECKKLTADVERALGRVTDDALKPEFHQRPRKQVRQ